MSFAEKVFPVSKNRTLFHRLLGTVLLITCLGFQAAAWQREEIPGMPSPFARTLGLDARNGIWASFMREQGLDTWGIGRIHPSPALFIPIRALGATRVFALLPSGDRVAVATDDGVRTVSSDGTVATHSVGYPLTHLAIATGGAFLAAGIDGKGGINLLRLAPGCLSERWHLAMPRGGRLRELLRLFARPDGTAVLVTAGEILVFSGSALHIMDLKNSPLASPSRGRSSERRVPPVWIYDAAMTPDGAVHLTGFSRQLVRWNGGTMKVIAHGHFRSLIPGSRAGYLWATDFDGGLWKGDDAGFGQVAACPEGQIEAICPGASEGIWLEHAPASGPHRLVPVPSSATKGVPEEQWHAWIRAGVALDVRPGLVSPGILSSIPMSDGGLCLATNAGIWRIRETPDALPKPPAP